MALHLRFTPREEQWPQRHECDMNRLWRSGEAAVTDFSQPRQITPTDGKLTGCHTRIMDRLAPPGYLSTLKFGKIAQG
jgi:hypothetical protein